MPNSARSWAFTLNNYTDADLRILGDIECQYVIYGKEVGQSGTPHLQGLITFKGTKRLPAVRRIVPFNRAHCEIAHNANDAINYCMKDGDYTIRNNRHQGARNDVRDAISIMTNQGLMALLNDEAGACVFVKYSQGLLRLLTMRIPKRDPAVPPSVQWIYGASGAGKTRWVVEREPDLFILRNPDWFDGYFGQSAVLFDEYRGTWWPLWKLLGFLDRYPVRCFFKGGSCEFSPSRIYITSPFTPAHCYANVTEENLFQLTRRITSLDDISELTE